MHFLVLKYGIDCMKRFIKENKSAIAGMIAVLLTIFLVGIVGTALMKNGKEEIILLILTVMIFWVIWLYIGRSETRNKYDQLLSFAHKFYKETKKTDDYDFEDYTVSDFEDEFEEWMREKEMRK